MSPDSRMCCTSSSAERDAGAGADGGKNTGPTIVLLYEARFIVHAREDGIKIFLVTRILLARQSDERFARRVG